MRIAFLGDSLTWGGYGGNFVDEIAKLRPQHELMNAGVGGNTIENLLQRLDDVLAQQPDGIFVMVGGNDAVAYSQPDTRGYYRKAQNLENGFITPDEFTRAYRDLLTQIQLAHVLAWVGLEPTEYSHTVFKALQEFNAIAREVAESLNVPVLDLTQHFRAENLPERPPINQKFINLIGERSRTGWQDYEAEQQRGGFTFTFDGMHLTPENARKVAELIVEFLEL
jgi:lysophospholipase L1-like esterase